MVFGGIIVEVNETPAEICWYKPTLGEIYFNDVQLQRQTSDTVTHFPGSNWVFSFF